MFNTHILSTLRNKSLNKDTSPEPYVSIIIPTAGYKRYVRKNLVCLVSNCVKKIYELTEYSSFEIVIIYNTELAQDIKEALKQYNCQFVQYNHSPHSFNLSEKMNLGAHYAKGEKLLFLNDDVEPIHKDWLKRMVDISSLEGVGCVGPLLLFSNNKVQHGGIIWPEKGHPTHAFYKKNYKKIKNNLLFVTRNCLGVTGACLLINKDLFHELKGFDPVFYMNYNDVDFCLKVLKKGLKIMWTPDVQLYHFESLSKGTIEQLELELLVTKWGVIKDPYFTPSLLGKKEYKKLFFYYLKRCLKVLG